jgi:hypothetical protein
VSTPQQHHPPVYGCSAGSVLHAHSGDTLEPAVVLWTFLPAGGSERLDAIDAKVDVHSDGPGSATLTLRVLSEGQSLSWQLPISPFVAALPGQPGDEGRVVLLAVMDAEPEAGFWAQPVDCERLAAELQIPVTDLSDALRGRLTPWLADDVDLLLHDDAHEHAADLSPAQTLANAVLAHYRSDLEADQHATRLVRAFDYAPKDFAAELGARLCVALTTAIVVAGPDNVARVVEEAGPFEPELARILTQLPPRMRPDDPDADDSDAAADVVLSNPDVNEALRASVTAIARLSRVALGEHVSAEDLLRRLAMADDVAEARLAALWVQLAVAADGPPDTDELIAAELGERVHAEGPPGGAWLRATSATLATLALDVAGRSPGRVVSHVNAVDEYLTERPRAGEPTPADVAADAARHSIALARFARSRGGIGPGAWRKVPVVSAVQGVAAAMVRGLDHEAAAELLDELLADDVDAVEVTEAFVCATAQILAEVDPTESSDVLGDRVGDVLRRLPSGPKGGRWLLLHCLRGAPDHDPVAADLRPHLPSEPVDLERVALKAGRRGVLRTGLAALEATSHLVGEGLGITREELLAMVLPMALVEHDMLMPGDV